MNDGRPELAAHEGRADLGAGVPTATIAICTRDRPELLRDALAALQSALSPDSEILVVDSGSTTAETALLARSAGIRYIRSDIPGLSIARNLALTDSTSPYVVFTDDDCTVAADFLAPLLAPFASDAVAAVTGTLNDQSTADSHTGGASYTLRRTQDGLDAGHGALMAFRRTTLLELGGFDPILGAGRRFGGAEDMDALCRVLQAGHEVVRVPDAAVTHRYTRSDEDYLRLNESYGLGIGAMCAKWLRTHRRAGLSLTALVLRRGVTRYVRRIGSARTRRGQARYLRGIAGGLFHARSIPVHGEVFADLQPLPAVPSAVETAPDVTVERRAGA